jgi:hypothetical protein
MQREESDHPGQSKLFIGFWGGPTVRTRQRNPRFVPKAMPRTLGTARGITSSLTGRGRQSGTDGSPVTSSLGIITGDSDGIRHGDGDRIIGAPRRHADRFHRRSARHTMIGRHGDGAPPRKSSNFEK